MQRFVCHFLNHAPSAIYSQAGKRDGAEKAAEIRIRTRIEENICFRPSYR